MSVILFAYLPYFFYIFFYLTRPHILIFHRSITYNTRVRISLNILNVYFFGKFFQLILLCHRPYAVLFTLATKYIRVKYVCIFRTHLIYFLDQFLSIGLIALPSMYIVIRANDEYIRVEMCTGIKIIYECIITNHQWR